MDNANSTDMQQGFETSCRFDTSQILDSSMLLIVVAEMHHLAIHFLERKWCSCHITLSFAKKLNYIQLLAFPTFNTN